MEALDLLLNRRSIAKLSEPAPEGQALENIIRAGLRAPDHAGLTPWRFVIAQGDGLKKLSDILVRAAEAENSEDAVIEKVKNAPFRAPMVITVIAKVTEHEKVQNWNNICLQVVRCKRCKWRRLPKVSKAFGVQESGCSIQKYIKRLVLKAKTKS